MEAQGVSLPLIHHHVMMPWNDLKKGDCCGRLEASSDGYYCKACDFFVHKKCGDEPCEYIEHPSHPGHILQLQTRVELERYHRRCDFCGRDIVNLGYHCLICDFDLDLYCAKNPPPEVIDVSETHRHKLTLLKQAWFEPREFSCDGKCGKIGEGFHYKCHECDLAFHVDCVWNPPPESCLDLRTLEEKETLQVEHPLEVNHSSHSWHPLIKLLTGEPPDYSDGKCR